MRFDQDWLNEQIKNMTVGDLEDFYQLNEHERPLTNLSPTATVAQPESLVKLLDEQGCVLSEHDEQVLVMLWAKENEVHWPDLRLLHANPMGGLRNKTVGAYMKAEGARAGVPDLFLPVARGGYHGLFIEMKRANGRPSDVRDSQRDWLFDLQDQGFACNVCYGSGQAENILALYLYQDRTRAIDSSKIQVANTFDIDVFQ